MERPVQKRNDIAGSLDRSKAGHAAEDKLFARYSVYCIYYQ